MPTTSKTAQIPYPVRADRVDGPGAFELMARRLDDITVVQFPSSTARGTAYSTAPARTPVKGTMTYLQDVNVFEFWNGTAWVPVLPEDYARGIVQWIYLEGGYPSDGTYVPQNTQRMVDDVDFTVNLTANRVYRVSAQVGIMDGGPGTGPTTGGCDINIMYNNSATMPTTTSLNISGIRLQALGDSTSLATGAYTMRVWTCPASGVYSFGLKVTVYNTGGMRLSGSRQLCIEDLGKAK